MVTIIDTPGFDDTTRSDSDILSAIAKWMQSSYEEGTLLSGVIYLHKITDNRITGSSMKNIRMFRKPYSADNMKNVLLVSSMWDIIQEKQGAERKKELSSEGTFWKSMIAQGATMHRYNNRTATALQLIKILISNTPSALKIQKQLVDDRVPLVNTEAGEDVNQELLKAKRQFAEELVAIREEHDAAIKSSTEISLFLPVP